MLLIAAASLLAQTGQGPTGISHHYRPGDKLHYTVIFDGDPNFDSVAIYFQSGPVPPNQSGLSNGFTLDHSSRISAGIFEVDGTIPESAATGTYQLSIVQTRIKPQGVKDYDVKSFHEAVEVDNGTKYEFPPIKSIFPK